VASTRISFDLTPELYEFAAARAERHGVSVNIYLRDRLVDALQRQKARDDARPEPRWKQSMAKGK